MAFHQPTRRPSQLRAALPLQEEERDVPQLHVQDPAATDASHSWVLFEPADDTTTASYLSEEEESLPTPGRSRLSDIGSLNTFLHSARDTESRQSGVLSSAIDDESVEDDAELDSLDSHLPEFRTVPSLYTQSAGAAAAAQSAPVLPAHDGLGSFRLDNPEVQEQIYAFERFNPKRVRRRRESLELAQLEMEAEEEQETHKMQRIEAWRLEQSRILLEEIGRETRRRRQSMVSVRPTMTTEDKKAEDLASLSAIGNEDDADSMDWHYESTDTKDDERGLLAKITRKVLNDLGIDERLLSILLGEQLPLDDDLSTTPKTGADLSSTPTQETNDSSWQLRALDRVAKELGLMVNQLSHHHPGAFSTYTRMQQMPIPYGGLPVIPESGADTPMAPKAQEVSTKMPEFQPTMVQHARPINIPASRPQSDPPVPLTRDESTPLPASFTQEEWEQDLDVNLVFRYLRSRFSSRSTPSSAFTTGTSHLATSSTPDTAAKAARVRQHHPLVSRARPVERRTFKATTPSSPAAIRHASSCASQSTRRSARRSSVSSRHYWDIGGSLGTGSVIASVGPMGSWGEV
ncbi:uncharacterized protein ColSpa_10564 [Colletotrichum spaethianum]|uniref:Uncharacterized protein n=1 Tax=Colletotrichum spaethianum TaxID=700344 RepID=A0AA37PDU0_9PEZI|nr:uncharacterized protein ColSpa_10564 [Colletotrichum spaethianum]GKT50383.1 hypothetical protein ColSpa_10564 [Colletotrichum spaethianum]